jgi:hypothetical protein
MDVPEFRDSKRGLLVAEQAEAPAQGAGQVGGAGGEATCVAIARD